MAHQLLSFASCKVALPVPTQVQITASGRASYRLPTFADLTEPDEADGSIRFANRSPNRLIEASDEFIAHVEDVRMEGEQWDLLKTYGMKWHYIKLDHAYAGRDMTDPETRFIPCLPGYTSKKFINAENLNLSWWKTVEDAYNWWQENVFCSIAGYASSYHAFEQVAPITKRRSDSAAFVGKKRRKLMDASTEIAMVQTSGWSARTDTTSSSASSASSTGQMDGAGASEAVTPVRLPLGASSFNSVSHTESAVVAVAAPTQRSIKETIMAILSALGQHTAEVLSSSLVRQANVAVTEVFGADSDLMNVTLREKVSRLCNELGIPAYEP